MAKFISFILLITILLSSCGFHKDTPVEETSIGQTSLEAQCNLDLAEFEHLLSKDIEDQLSCLEENLLLYTRYVRTDIRGVIKQVELKNFIGKFFNSGGEQLVSGLTLFFQVNTLILREKRNHLPRAKIKLLIKLLVSANKEMIKISDIIKLLKNSSTKNRALNYKKLRLEFFNSVKRLSNDALKILNTTPTDETQIKIKELVTNVLEQMRPKAPAKTTKENEELTQENEDLIKTILFSKHLILGGKRDIITSAETRSLFVKTPHLMLLAFDLIFANDNMEVQQHTRLDFFKKRINDFKALTHNHKDETLAFTKTQLKYVLEKSLSSNGEAPTKKIEAIINSISVDLLGLKPGQNTYKYKHYRLFVEYLIAGVEGLEFKESFTAKSSKENSLEKVNSIHEDYKKLNESLLNLFDNSSYFPANIDILSFLSKAQEVLELELLTNEDIEVAKTLKQYFIGGKPQEMTQVQISTFFEKSPSIVKEILKSLFTKHDPNDIAAKNDFIIERIEQLQKLKENSEKSSLKLSTLTSLINRTSLTPDNKTAILSVANFLKNEKSISITDLLQIAKIGLKSQVAQGTATDSLRGVTTQSYSIKKSQFLSTDTQIEQMLFHFEELLKNKEEGINIYELLKSLAQTYPLINEWLPRIKSLLPLKRLILGGKDQILTHSQIRLLRSKLPQLTKALFPLINISIVGQLKDIKSSLEIATISKSVNELILSGNDDEVFLTSKALLKMIDANILDENFEKFKPTVDEFIFKVIDQRRGPKGVIKYSHLKELANWLEKLTGSFYYNQKNFELNPKLLEQSTGTIKVSSIETDFFTKKDEQEHRENLEFILNKFRYFKTQSNKISTYSKDKTITVYGSNELSALHFILTRIVNGYGSKVAGSDKLELTVKNVDTLLKDFKPILQVFNLWSTTIETFAQNTVLLSDLFQSMSNGNGSLDATEITEYSSLVLIAIEMSFQFREKLKLKCSPQDYHAPLQSFRVTCYRPQFFKILMEDLGYKKQFPKLYRYTKDASEAEILNFLKNVEGFARDFPDRTIPINERELTLLIGSLINIEATLLRFDTNDDNYIDDKELEKAFLIYKSSIIKIADIDEDSRFTKTIFFYMVREMEIPSKSDVFFAHYSPRAWKIKGKRLNIGALLYYLVKQR